MDPVRRRTVLGAAILAAAVTGGCASAAGPSARAAGRPGATGAPITAPAPSSTSISVAATTTTVDPGRLPQTAELPSSRDPQFLARMSDLVAAVSSGRVSDAAGAFFPLGAYIQVKGISDPVHDYQTRLMADFAQDVGSLHAELDPAGSALRLVSVDVPAAAEWIRPGVEYNKGSYWRVYGTRIHYAGPGGATGAFTVASLISWRGEWYIVHLSSIR